MAENNKVIALVETRLTSDLHFKGFKSLQTSHNTKGGCYISSNVERQKNIKTILSNFAWTSIAIKNVPIHIITCYVRNGGGKEAIQDIQRLDHTLNLILGRLPQSRVIIAGDFNQ